jgi:branched-chain amino acid transport system permease protein
MDIQTTVGKSGMSPLKVALWVLLALSLIFLPILFEGFGYYFMTRIMGVVGLYVLLALGLNIVVGYAGLLDLGYIAFYAIGAYSGVIVGTKVVEQFPAFGPWSYYAMLPLAAAAAALTGIMLGTPVLRLRGDYLAIVTLGFGEIVRIIITNDPAGITNGAAGLPRATEPSLPMPFPFDWLAQHAILIMPDLGARGFNFTFSRNLFWYYMIVLLCLLAIFVIRRLDDSRLGRSWVAMREDEVAAASMGVSIRNTKLWAFSLGATFGGIAGLTFANYQQFVSPESFTFMESVFVVCAVVIGGMGSIPGAIVGALIIAGIPELIRGVAGSGLLQLSGEQVSAISNYRNLIFGLVIVLMMIWRPQGLIPSKRRAAELQASGEEADIESETLYDAQHDTGESGGDNNF